MAQDIEQDTKVYLETFIPEAVSQVMTSCVTLLAQSGKGKDLEEIKEFLEFHKACKAAISNIESLLKLYHWTENKKGAGYSPEEIKQKVREAEDRIKKYLDEKPTQ